MSKADIRREVRRRRQELNSNDQWVAACRLGSAARALRAFRCSRRIALYLANDAEISPAWILSYAQDAGKACYAPVIFGNRKDSILRFAPWDSERVWKPNRYGIPEPNVPMSTTTRPEELDLIFLPLVAFDDGGRRIGMGGGFYDRTLGARSRRRRWRRPRLIGIAHECQRVDRIPADSWDVPLDGILTDQRFIAC